MTRLLWGIAIGIAVTRGCHHDCQRASDKAAALSRVAAESCSNAVSQSRDMLAQMRWQRKANCQEGTGFPKGAQP